MNAIVKFDAATEVERRVAFLAKQRGESICAWDKAYCNETRLLAHFPHMFDGQLRQRSGRQRIDSAALVMGFFTKFGDGAADVVRLSGLNKRRVRVVAAMLGAPEQLVYNVPTADLESNPPLRPDDEAYGVTYDQIDDLLEGEEVDGQARKRILHAYHGPQENASDGLLTCLRCPAYGPRFALRGRPYCFLDGNKMSTYSNFHSNVITGTIRLTLVFSGK